MHDIEKVIKGLEFTKAMITFNPLTGEDIDPEDLNEDNKITYDACIGAITLLKEQKAKNGYWINPTSQDCQCSECGEQPVHEPGESVPLYDFCPYCGAKMEVKWNE